jgi:CHAT domain-containing protein
VRKYVQRVSICLFLTAFSQIAKAQVAQTPRQELDRALNLLAIGKTDQGLKMMQDAAALASGQGDKRTAAYIQLRLAPAFRDFGDDHAATNTLLEAVGNAAGTDLEAIVQTSLYLQLARVAGRAGDPLGSLKLLFSADELLPQISNEPDRLGASSEELSLRTSAYLSFLREEEASLKTKPAAQLSLSSQIFLLSAISHRPPKYFDSLIDVATKSLPVDLLKGVDAARPFEQVILKAAREMNQRATLLDEERGRKSSDTRLGKLELAKDKSQLADIEELSGNLEHAIALRKEALQTYQEIDSFPDYTMEMDALSFLYLKQRSGEGVMAAGNILSDLVFAVESQTQSIVGQTVDDFLAQYHSAYIRYFYILSHFNTVVKNDKSMEVLIRQADRMNFRATRRDLALYRELGDLSGTDTAASHRLEQQHNALLAARQERDRALQARKTAADFQVSAGTSFVEGDSPFGKYRDAKKEFVNILADFARKRVEAKEPYTHMTLAQIRHGMTAADAIVMYFRQEPRPPELYASEPSAAQALLKPTLIQAAVITDSGVRLVQLSIDAKRVRDLASGIRKKIAVSYSEASGDLKELATGLWSPLGMLPTKLTIVLTPDLVGVPFEALPGQDGELIVNRYALRYAFGLAPDLGAVQRSSAYNSAFVVGAETFSRSVLDPLLPGSGDEVRALREFFKNHGVAVSPSVALPETARTQFLTGGRFGIIHLSTHSSIDGQVPLLDSLVFPKDELSAYDLALSPMRANLVVLSACELFSPTSSSANQSSPFTKDLAAQMKSLYPVSGITTASLARIAPEIVSTLWTVSASAATRIFMLRFYSALLETKEPSLALAITKREFLNPSSLRLWMMANDIAVPPDAEIESFRKPYNWAPFVLAVGIPHEWADVASLR